jgi:hypothetical protein
MNQMKFIVQTPALRVSVDRQEKGGMGKQKRRGKKQIMGRGEKDRRATGQARWL